MATARRRANTHWSCPSTIAAKMGEVSEERRERWWDGAHRLEIGNALSGNVTLLCAQEALLLEDEAGADEEAA